MNSITSYEAFEFRLRISGGGIYELDIRSPAGQGHAALDGKQLSAMKELLAAEGQRSAPVETARDLHHVSGQGLESPSLGDRWLTPDEIGGKLRVIVLPDWALRLFEASREQLAGTLQRGLCLRFHFDLTDGNQAELAGLPWELLAGSDNPYLAHSVETPILRYLDLAGMIRPFKKPTRLGILLVVAEPEGALPLEGLYREVDRVQAAWEQDNVYVRILRGEDGADLSLDQRLREMLRQEEFHVLHFMGHGAFDPTTQEGLLCLEGERRQLREVSGAELAGWLLNHRSLRLVVLNACETGRLADARPFAGVATALVRGGIPAVLAMQDRIPDRLAVELGRVLYQELAAGAPVEAALSEARRELAAVGAKDSRDWSIPVLLTRTPNIISVPPRIGETLTRWWTLLGSAHFLWSFGLFLRNRSLVPGLDRLVDAQVAAFLGVFFGLPLFYASLYCAIEYARHHRPPAKEEEEASLWRRIALRLPVAFHARVQGRRINEATYQLAFLLLLVVAAMVLQGYLFAEVLKAPVWLQRETVLHSDTRWEALFEYVPFGQAVFHDNYRLGSIDTRPGVGKIINNVTYFPFWGSWGLLLAELLALVLVFYLLRLLTQDRPSRAGK